MRARTPFASPLSRVYRPFIRAAAAAGVRHVAFLSVQGAERHRHLLHSQVERLLAATPGLAWTAIRPAYFMQALLRPPLVNGIRRGVIELPAGDARLNWAGGRRLGRQLRCHCSALGARLLCIGTRAPVSSHMQMFPLTHAHTQNIRNTHNTTQHNIAQYTAQHNTQHDTHRRARRRPAGRLGAAAPRRQRRRGLYTRE